MKLFFNPNRESILKTKSTGLFLSLKYLKNFVILILISNLLFCNRPFPWDNKVPNLEDKKTVAVPRYAIVRSKGNLKIIHADRTEERGNIGVFLYEGDMLQIESGGMVDIQHEDETLLRIFQNSVLHVTKLEKEKPMSKLSLSKGSALVKLFSGSPGQTLVLLMNSMVVTAEAAEFYVEQEKGISVARVKFGKPFAYPRFLSLGDTDPREFKENDPAYPIAKIVMQTITPIDTMKEVSISEKLELYKSLEEITNSPDWESSLSSTKLQVNNTSFSPEFLETSNSLTPVDSKLLDSIYNLGLEIQKNQKEPARIEELEAKRSTLENQLLKFNYQIQGESKIQTNTVNVSKKQEKSNSPITKSISKRLTYYKKIGKYKKPVQKKFQNREELYSYYERLEKLILTDGNFEIGTIISQDEETIILHAEDGIRRIPTSSVQEVTYDIFKRTKP